MTILSPISCRRLQQLPKTQSVWEGDRRLLTQHLAPSLGLEPSPDMKGDCILWVDGSEGFVRGVDVVPSDTGHEAVVRTLLQAMEHPHGSVPPSRPGKIVVRDREIQFFLRGALQNLDIVIEYVPELPLIDEVFQGLQQQIEDSHLPPLPEECVEALHQHADALWDIAPWTILDEQQIIAVELNRWDIDTVYLSVLGMMGMEFGVLMYRSLESLKQFRQRVLRTDQSSNQMQQAFLEQDCIFLTFDPIEDESDTPDLALSPDLNIQNWIEAFVSDTEREPSYGVIHPLEGLRTQLVQEEAFACIAILSAFQRFVRRYADDLSQDDLPDLKERYRIANPEPGASPKTISVKVQTLPEIAEELIQMADDSPLSLSLPTSSGETRLPAPVLQDDLVPEKSLVQFSVLSWEWVEYAKDARRLVYSPLKPSVVETGQGLPVVMIHTSQPKGSEMMDLIQSAGGLQHFCFNLGEDPFNAEEYDLALVQTQDGRFHLVAEYLRDNARYRKQRQQWENACKKLKGRCGIAIAKGVTGKNRGNPQLRDLMAIYEVNLVEPSTLGLSPLQLQFAIDWS